jgi:hypothetical protein
MATPGSSTPARVAPDTSAKPSDDSGQEDYSAEDVPSTASSDKLTVTKTANPTTYSGPKGKAKAKRVKANVAPIYSREYTAVHDSYNQVIGDLKLLLVFLQKVDADTRHQVCNAAAAATHQLKETCHKQASLYSRTARNAHAALNLHILSHQQESHVRFYLSEIDSILRNLRLTAWNCPCWRNTFAPPYVVIRGKVFWTTSWRKENFEASLAEDTALASPPPKQP